MTAARADGAGPVQAVDRAIRILQWLAGRPEGAGLSAIGRAVGVLPQTAQGLVRTLQARALVQQSRAGGPSLVGPELARLAQAWEDPARRGAVAGDIVRRVASETGESVILVEWAGAALRLLAHSRAPQALAVVDPLPPPERLHAAATGQVLLAPLPEPEWRRRVGGPRLRRYGPGTLSSVAELRARLADVRERGAAVCRDENGEHISAAAVPVRDGGGRVIAALGAAVPSVRFDAAAERRILLRLRRAAAEIEAAWNGTAARPRPRG
jgi:DNA-binding IclR family transcriptional regulator